MHSSVRVLMSLVVTLAGAGAPLAQAPDQPFASYWFPNELLAWSPDSDPDAAFNRSNTPLATRFFNPDLNVNAHAHPNEAGVMVLSAFGPTTIRTTTMRRDFGRVLATAMLDSGVRRMQLVSAAFLFPWAGWLGAVLKPTLFRYMAPDMA